MSTSTAIAQASVTPTRIVGVGRSRSGGTIVVVDGNGLEHRCTSALELWDAMQRIVDDPTIENVTEPSGIDKAARTPMQRALAAILGAGRKHLDKKLGTDLADAVTTVGNEAIGQSTGFLGRISTRGSRTIGRSRRR